MSNDDKHRESDIKAEKLIREYVNGTISPEDEDRLWELMVENPQYYEHLKLNSALKKMYESGSAGNTSESGDSNAESGNETDKGDAKITRLFGGQYGAWIVAAAAVLALVIGLNLLKVSSPGGAEDMFALSPENSPLVASVDVLYFESIEAFRDEATDDPFTLRFDESLLAAFTGEFDEALTIYQDLIRDFPEDDRIFMAYLNSGIIYFNDEKYDEAAGAFEQALSKANGDRDFNEKTTWLLANSKLHKGNLEQGLQTLYIVVEYDGIYHQEALELIRTIEPYIVPGAMP